MRVPSLCSWLFFFFLTCVHFFFKFNEGYAGHTWVNLSVFLKFVQGYARHPVSSVTLFKKKMRLLGTHTGLHRTHTGYLEHKVPCNLSFRLPRTQKKSYKGAWKMPNCVTWDLQLCVCVNIPFEHGVDVTIRRWWTPNIRSIHRMA